MKVVTKYKRVEIEFNKQIVSVCFNSVKDALVYTSWSATLRIKELLTKNYLRAVSVYYVRPIC